MICFDDPLPASDAVVEQTTRLRETVERMWRTIREL